MAKNTENKNTELLEKPVQTKTTKETVESTVSKLDFESFFEKNKKIFFALAGLIVLAGIAYGGYKYLSSTQEVEAAKEMFIPQKYYELDSLDLALKGDKVNRGFLDIQEEYNLSASANLCNFYIGHIYLKQGKYEDAIEYLKKFSAGDLLVQARAYSLTGDAYSELNDSDNAISYYKKAAGYEPNEYFTPRYLLKLAFAYEIAKDYENAIKTYSTIINDYSKSQEYNDARKYKARAEELSQQ